MTTTALLPPAERLREKLDLDDTLKAELTAIEDRTKTYTLADAIREGAKVTSQRVGGWVTEEESCSFGAAFIAAQARGLV